MRQFFTQLKWEFVRLAYRPRTWLAFWLSLLFEICVSVLLKAPGVRAAIARDVWKMREQWNDVFSGLTTATHIAGESLNAIGVLGIALVTAEIVSGERTSGTLRMMFSRPVSRGAVLAAKGIVCAVYAAVVVLYIGLTSLAVGLLFEGPGNLVLLAPHEGVMGAFHFGEGLQRYFLSLPFMWFSALSGLVWPLLFSCTRMKPSAAVVLALMLFTADNILRTTPETKIISPYCVTTRMLSWRQVFNDDIPWPRIERNYIQLAIMDTAFLIAAAIAIRRLESRP